MGLKQKTPSAKRLKSPSGVKRSSQPIGQEHPSKKHCFNAGKQFIENLKGPDPMTALKTWLYLVSNLKERAQLDKETMMLEHRHASQEPSLFVSPSYGEGLSPDTTEEIAQAQGFDGEDSYLEHIDNFLWAGGCPSHFINLLPAANDATYSKCRLIFKALSKVLLRIAAAHKERITKTSNYCHEVLNSHIHVLKGMLENSKTFAQRKLALEVMTAMTVLDSKLGKEIILLPILNGETVQNLTSSVNPLDVRIAYHNFLIALLMDVDDSLIHAVINKPWLITAIMNDLQFDPSQTIVMLLVTLQKSIVINRHITKTAKLVVFDSNTILCLFRLYTWKGPQNRPRARSQWDVKKAAEQKGPLADVDKDEADIVAKVVHELLLLLLTDHRFGIIFRDPNIGFREDRLNSLVVKVLQKIGQFWEHPKSSELISKTLAACPDAVSSTMASMEPFIFPRSSPKWFKCADFLKQVIQDQRPCEILQRQASKLSSKKFCQALIEMCAPPHIVKALCSRDAVALCDPNAPVAVLVFELLVCMLKRISTCLEEIQLWHKKGIMIKFVAVRHIIRDMIPQMFPSIICMEKVWRYWCDQMCQANAGSTDEASELSSTLPVLSSLLMFLDSYRSVCPAILESFISTQSSLKFSMMNTVQSLTGVEAALLRNSFYKLLLAAHDNSFTMESQAVHESLVHLFEDVLSTSHDVRDLAHFVLQTLIERSRLLEGSRGEAHIWILAYQETFLENFELANDLKVIIVESIIRASSQYLMYLNVIATSEEQLQAAQNSSQTLFKDMLMSVNSSAVETSSERNQKSFSISTVSPWLPALIEVLREQPYPNKKKKHQFSQLIQKFLMHLIVRLSFRFLHPLPPINLILRDASEMLPSHLTVYLKSWLPGNVPQPLKRELFDNESLELELSQYLYSGSDHDEDKVVQLLQSIDKCSLPGKVAIKNTQLNVIQFVYIGSFHLTQWTRLNFLSKQRANNCKNLLSEVLKFASQLDCSVNIKSKSLVEECLEVLFSHPLLLQNFSPLPTHRTSSEYLLTDILIALASAVNYDALENVVLDPYKNKMLSAIHSAAKEKIPLENNPVPMTNAFQLTFHEISNLFNLFLDFPFSLTLQKVNDITVPSHWYQLAVHLLMRLTDLRSKEVSDCKTLWILSPLTMHQFSTWVIEMLKMENVDCSSMQQSLLFYIQSCPQQSIYIPKQLLPSLLNASKLTTVGQNLASCLSRSASPRDIVDLLKTNCKPGRRLLEQPDVLLPVLGAVLKSEEALGVVGSNWFKTVYDHLKSMIERSITNAANHPDWLKVNIDVIVTLIEFCMTSESRSKICDSLEKNVTSLSVERLYHLQLVVAVLKNHPVQLLQFFLMSLCDALRKQDSGDNQGPLVQAICLEILQNVSKKVKNVKLRERIEWQETIRLALKLSLRLSDYVASVECDMNCGEENEENSISNQTDVSSLLLRVLTFLFNMLYSPEEEHEHVTMVYKLTTLHSEFVNTMTDSSPSKIELVQFLHTIVTLQPSIANGVHVPVILAAYGAMLNKTDIAILKLLQAYERTGINLSQYKPYLWGKEGANHYSVWSDTSQGSQTLWQQPKPNQVLGLLSKDIIKTTIANFPLQRKLNIDEDNCVYADNAYDPSFFLPLFSHLLAPDSPVLTPRFVRSGALAITFSCLSSHDTAVRAAAYTTLARFLSNLHMASGSNKLVLLHLMSSVQKGVMKFGEKNPQLPSVSSVFLAQTAVELANPLSNLYQPLIKFILAKPVIKLDTIPEFWTFLHSESVHYLAHRCWILKVISCGLRDRCDFELSLKVVAFKILPAFYTTCLPNTDSKVLILQCLRSAVQNQYGACCLVRDYALISWLHQTILGLSLEDVSLISEMILILRTLWKSLCLPFCPSIPQIIQPGNKIIPLMFALLPKLSVQLSVTTLIYFISTLSSLIKALKSDVHKCSFNGEEIFSLIDICSPLIQKKRELYEIPKLGCNFVELDSGVQFLDECISVDKNVPDLTGKLHACLKHLLILCVGKATENWN